MSRSAEEALAGGPASTVPEAEPGVVEAAGRWNVKRLVIAVIVGAVVGGLTLSLSGDTGTSYSLLGWIIPLILATAIIGVIGVLLQQVFLRWNQGQDLRQALITIALSVIFADQMLAAFGGISKDIKTPSDWPDSINVFDVRFGFFRAVIVLG